MIYNFPLPPLSSFSALCGDSRRHWGLEILVNIVIFCIYLLWLVTFALSIPCVFTMAIISYFPFNKKIKYHYYHRLGIHLLRSSHRNSSCRHLSPAHHCSVAILWTLMDTRQWLHTVLLYAAWPHLHACCCPGAGGWWWGAGRRGPGAGPGPAPPPPRPARPCRASSPGHPVLSSDGLQAFY